MLSGKFAVLPITKFFLGFAFLFLAFCAVMTCVQSVRYETRNVVVSLVPLGMILLFATIALFGQWLARNDIAWLSSRIAAVLCKVELDAASIAIPPPSRHRPLLILQGLLALAAVGCWASSVTGVQAIQTTGNGIEISYHSPPGRIISGVCGFALAVFLYGVYQRSMIAWAIGMVWLPVGGILAIAQVLLLVWNGPWANQPDAMRWLVTGFMTVVTIAISAFWSFWWFRQRRHFSPTI